MPDNILVLGAGELGASILTHLSSLAPPETKITVLLRPSTLLSPSPSKAKHISSLRALDISFLPGDIATSSPSQLSELFKPFSLLISCLGFSSGPVSQLKIVTAVLSAGVKRFVPWQFGVDYDIIGPGSAQDLFDEQVAVRALLRGQKETEWVIISTGMFTSFLFEPSTQIVDFEHGIVRALGGWENRVTVTSVEDIGKLTARILYEEPRIGNEVVFTAGETVSYGRLAEVVEDVMGRKMRREVRSMESLRGELGKDPGNAMRKYWVVFAEGSGVSWEMEKTFNGQRGIEMQDVERYLREILGRSV